MKSPRDLAGRKVEDPREVLSEIEKLRAAAGKDWPTATPEEEPEDEEEQESLFG